MGTKQIGRTAAAFGLVAILGAVSLTGCVQPQPPKSDGYVALGDSAAAAPLVPDPVLGDDIGCFRSTNDYPALVAKQIHVAHFLDATCSSATTDDITHAQTVPIGDPRPPQDTRVNSTTKVITLTMGGNDFGFGGVLQNCIRINPFDTPCSAGYTAGGRDRLREQVASVAPKLDASLADLKRKAPNATIFVVGYLTYLPSSGDCWPVVPILQADVTYLRGINAALNDMLRARAQAAGVQYVDVATPGIGHDMCSANRWVEPIIPSPVTPAAPAHPNINGTRGAAAVVAAAINAKVPA